MRHSRGSGQRGTLDGLVMMVFGEREDIALWKVAGIFEDSFILDLGKWLADLVGMKIEGSDVKSFPNAQGNGGTGIQIYWAWTDSFLVISTWPELGFIRIYMASCKPFVPCLVSKFLKAQVGEVTKFRYAEI